MVTLIILVKMMARKLTEKEFITELAERWNTTYESARVKYYELIDFMCDELLMYGFIDLPTFGNFRTELHDGKYIYLPTVLKNDTPEKVWIEPYNRIRFKASKTLKDYINKDKVTKAETIRLRKQIKKQNNINKEKEHQIEIAENRQLIMEAVLQKKQQRKKQNGKKPKAINTQYSYWDDLKE